MKLICEISTKSCNYIPSRATNFTDKYIIPWIREILAKCCNLNSTNTKPQIFEIPRIWNKFIISCNIWVISQIITSNYVILKPHTIEKWAWFSCQAAYFTTYFDTWNFNINPLSGIIIIKLKLWNLQEHEDIAYANKICLCVIWIAYQAISYDKLNEVVSFIKYWECMVT